MIVLTEREYERLAPKYMLDEARNKIMKLNMAILDITNDGKCEAKKRRVL